MLCLDITIRNEMFLILKKLITCHVIVLSINNDIIKWMECASPEYLALFDSTIFCFVYVVMYAYCNGLL